MILYVNIENDISVFPIYRIITNLYTHSIHQILVVITVNTKKI